MTRELHKAETISKFGRHFHHGTLLEFKRSSPSGWALCLGGPIYHTYVGVVVMGVWLGT